MYAAPNNDNCFDENDFIQFRNNTNNATRQQGAYKEAREKIKALGGTLVQVTSTKDETVEWKVVSEVTEDDFAEVRVHEEELYHEQYCTELIDIAVGETCNYSDMFWHLWHGGIMMLFVQSMQQL